eukprot:TRINITY_DN13633_c0_g1_i1.p1 TRINITY_DN13633_c0_g1~~TRINITY_DN13633_c0_g1_i1.p1  ORF type:complete len:545 (+),score=78.86 TRINITY_DN13633_c0_g1_i1:67-1701(+)
MISRKICTALFRRGKFPLLGLQSISRRIQTPYLKAFQFSTKEKETPTESNEIPMDNKLILQLQSQEYLEKHEVLCKGCGIQLQSKDETGEGYIPANKVLHLLQNHSKGEPQTVRSMSKSNIIIDEVLRSSGQQQGNTLIQPKGKDSTLIEITDIDQLNEINERLETEESEDIPNLNLDNNNMICQRCHTIRSGAKPNTLQSFGLKYHIDPEKWARKIFQRVAPKSTFLVVLDISDFTSSLLKEIFDQIRYKKGEVIIVVNKMDIVPSMVSESRIRGWIRKRLDDLGAPSEELYLLSAKTGQGVSRLINDLKSYGKKLDRSLKKNLYVLGATNAGKSSLINSIIMQSSHNKTHYRSPYESLEAELFDLNQTSNTDVTTSTLPGTTLDVFEVEGVHIGWRVFDTPGIPNPQSLTTKVENLAALNDIAFTKQTQPATLPMSDGETLWIGGLARLDIQCEEVINFKCFTSNRVNLHRTRSSLANQYYLKHYGGLVKPIIHEDPTKVEFERHEIKIEINERAFANYDLELFGVGWISFEAADKLSLIHI